MSRLIVALVAVFTVACAATSARNSTPDRSDLAAAFASGRLRFEVRGLKNDVEKTEYSTSFTHHASVVALGDSALARQPFWVLFSVKRLSGGNPENQRAKDDVTLVFVRDGIGELKETGGYKVASASEKWDPEVIEVAPVAVIPLIAISGTSVRE